MRCAERQKSVHLTLELLQKRHRGARNEAPQRVGHEAEAPERGAGAPLGNVAPHLRRQADPHLGDVAIGVVLVRGRRQERRIRVRERQIVPHQPHVERVALKPVHENKEVQATVWLRVGGEGALGLGGRRRDAVDAAVDERPPHGGGACEVALLEDDGAQPRRGDERPVLHGRGSTTSFLQQQRLAEGARGHAVLLAVVLVHHMHVGAQGLADDAPGPAGREVTLPAAPEGRGDLPGGVDQDCQQLVPDLRHPAASGRQLQRRLRRQGSLQRLAAGAGGASGRLEALPDKRRRAARTALRTGRGHAADAAGRRRALAGLAGQEQLGRQELAEHGRQARGDRLLGPAHDPGARRCQQLDVVLAERLGAVEQRLPPGALDAGEQVLLERQRAGAGPWARLSLAAVRARGLLGLGGAGPRSWR
mmetsp:Transcript_85553/g.231821  ORF Transcript_85553/g.231821 Transcript_85553/m.231821 type:complete len:420 (+) Transcript_85553:712-1971(+)